MKKKICPRAWLLRKAISILLGVSDIRNLAFKVIGEAHPLNANRGEGIVHVAVFNLSGHKKERFSLAAVTFRVPVGELYHLEYYQVQSDGSKWFRS